MKSNRTGWDIGTKALSNKTIRKHATAMTYMTSRHFVVRFQKKKNGLSWTVTVCSSHVDFLTNWFVASTKFGVDGGIVVVSAEDDAMASLITDVSMVQQIERPFALMDSRARYPLVLMVRSYVSSQLISLTTRREAIGAQLSMRRRHPQGLVRHGRVARCRRYVPSDW